MSMDYIRVEVPELYPYVMLSAGAITFQCIIVGFLAGGKRGKLFDHEKLKEKFGDEHQKNFKTDPPKGGYPDHGDGRFADDLSYADWYQFSLDQRSHKNFLEQLTINVFLLLVIGLVYPIAALVFAGIHFVFRIIYVIGYRSGATNQKLGANARAYGGLVINPASIIMMIMAVVALSVWVSEIPKI